MRTVLLLAGDAAALGAAFWLMIRAVFPGHLSMHTAREHSVAFAWLGLAWIVIFFLFNLYDTRMTRPTIPHLRQIFLAFIAAFLVGIIFFYAMPSFGIAPKTNLVVFAGAALVFFLGWRRFFYAVFSSHFRRRVAFIARGAEDRREVSDIAEYIRAYPQSGFEALGVFDSLASFRAAHPGDMPVVFIVSREVWRDEASFAELFARRRSEILDLAYAYEDILGRVPLGAIDEGWFMHNIRSERKKLYDAEKRVSSLILAIAAVIITSPIWILVMLAIAVFDPGPILYSQIRVGRGGKPFRLYKFRSMKVDAEKEGAVWAAKEDPRITRVGRVIRTLHVDEIPQMWNVIRGDIALVGPRPERPEFVRELEGNIPFYHLRQVITPGFTGWAQIKFRYARTVMDSRQKFEYDLYYLKNRNIVMDIGIILRTVQIIFIR